MNIVDFQELPVRATPTPTRCPVPRSSTRRRNWWAGHPPQITPPLPARCCGSHFRAGGGSVPALGLGVSRAAQPPPRAPHPRLYLSISQTPIQGLPFLQVRLRKGPQHLTGMETGGPQEAGRGGDTQLTPWVGDTPYPIWEDASKFLWSPSLCGDPSQPPQDPA